MGFLHSSPGKKKSREYAGHKYDGPRALVVQIDGDNLLIQTNDGKWYRISFIQFPLLKNATNKQRQNFELIGNGIGIHWPDIDEDLSIEGLIKDRTAVNP